MNKIINDLREEVAKLKAINKVQADTIFELKGVIRGIGVKLNDDADEVYKEHDSLMRKIK